MPSGPKRRVLMIRLIKPFPLVGMGWIDDLESRKELPPFQLKSVGQFLRGEEGLL